jgi:hypothetical protein
MLVWFDVDHTPHELRRQAEHCRHLAEGQFDERVRRILNGMAAEFDHDARELAEQEARRAAVLRTRYTK